MQEAANPLNWSVAQSRSTGIVAVGERGRKVHRRVPTGNQNAGDGVANGTNGEPCGELGEVAHVGAVLARVAHVSEPTAFGYPVV